MINKLFHQLLITYVKAHFTSLLSESLVCNLALNIQQHVHASKFKIRMIVVSYLIFLLDNSI